MGGHVLNGDVAPRINGIPEVGQGTKDEGGVDRLKSELTVNEDESHDQQEDVDAGNPGAQVATEDVGEHDGETGDGADDKLGGHKKVVDGSGSNHHAEGHDDQFFPELEGFHVGDSLVDFFREFTHC